jgi:hypothetical protein
MASSIFKVLISYNRSDRDWAEWIAGVLKEAGYEPILEVSRSLRGESFVLRMQQLTSEADITVALLLETYLKAELSQPEWAAALAQVATSEKRQLISVRVARCSLEGLLQPTVYIDLVDLSEQDAERALLDGLKPYGKPVQPQPLLGKRAESGISSAPFPPKVARLHGVPDLPSRYLPREADLAD